MWNLKYETNELSVKQQQTHIHREHACGCQGGGIWGRDGEGGWA